MTTEVIASLGPMAVGVVGRSNRSNSEDDFMYHVVYREFGGTLKFFGLVLLLSGSSCLLLSSFGFGGFLSAFREHVFLNFFWNDVNLACARLLRPFGSLRERFLFLEASWVLICSKVPGAAF